MKEVNANIIYTKVSPTEYIGEFTVSPEETTDYELRAIDDEHVVEKCEVLVEESPVYNTVIWFAHNPHDPDIEILKIAIENGRELQPTYRGVYIGVDSSVTHLFVYDIFSTNTKDESEIVTPISSGTITSNSVNVNDLLGISPRYGTGYRAIIIKLEDNTNFIIWIKDEEEEPQPTPQFSVWYSLDSGVYPIQKRYVENGHGVEVINWAIHCGVDLASGFESTINYTIYEAGKINNEYIKGAEVINGSVISNMPDMGGQFTPDIQHEVCIPTNGELCESPYIAIVFVVGQEEFSLYTKNNVQIQPEPEPGPEPGPELDYEGHNPTVWYSKQRGAYTNKKTGTIQNGGTIQESTDWNLFIGVDFLDESEAYDIPYTIKDDADNVFRSGTITSNTINVVDGVGVPAVGDLYTVTFLIFNTPFVVNVQWERPQAIEEPGIEPIEIEPVEP